MPVKSELGGAHRQIMKFRGHPQVSSILVSVSQPGTTPGDFLALKALGPNVQIWLQTKDLGLYGNFRFLLEKAAARWCFFAAVDDDISESLLCSKLLTAQAPPSLVVPVQHLVNVERAERPFPGTVAFLDTVGQVCDSEKMNDISRFFSGPNVLNAPTSWIFGIWRTSYLRDIYPRKNFNWLDSYVIARAILDEVIQFDWVSNPSLIGVWPDRPPNAVGRSWRTPFGWLVQCLKDSTVRTEVGLGALLWNDRVRYYILPSGGRRLAKRWRAAAEALRSSCETVANKLSGGRGLWKRC